MLREKTEQEIFVKYCDSRGIKCVFIPNGFPIGGVKNKYMYINSLKAQGYRTGFPDLIVLAQNSKKEVLFIEFKRTKGGRVSEKQLEWQRTLSDMGYDTFIANGAKHAIMLLEDWLTK